MASAYIVAGVSLFLWIMSVAFAAGIIVKASRETTRRVQELEDNMSKLMNQFNGVANDVRWVKQYLGFNGKSYSSRASDED